MAEDFADGQGYAPGGGQEYAPNGEQYYENGEGGVGPEDGYDDVPDMLQLNYLCSLASAPADNSEEARREADESWEPVREWLRNHNADEVRQAAEQRGESSMTAMHFACRNRPPLDIIDVFLSIAIETAQWPDTFGWLPIHYACACSADTEVIKALAEAFPDSKTTVDRRGRTPLHFALGNQNPDRLAPPAVIAILSSTGAASYADDNGMLPLHYACAYGASEEALYVLTDAYLAAAATHDQNGRTPLHFALSNAGRAASPGAVRHLLDLDKNLANSNNGPLPLRVLAEFSKTVAKTNAEGDRESVQKCMEYLLNSDPEPTADFFTALQSLPDWLGEQAVVMPSVQVLLNDKISQRFPTLILMLDFYFLSLVITFYSLDVPRSIRKRFEEDATPSTIALPTADLLPLYVGGIYFLVRETIQMISLLSLKSLHIWLYDPNKLLSVCFIFLVFFWTIQMNIGTGNAERFRTGTALTVTVLWFRVLGYLRNMLIDFAVFAGGVFNVFKRLVAFLIVLGIILVCFAQMFTTVYQNSEYCEDFDRNITAPFQYNDVRCGEDEDHPYCDYWLSFIDVYTMLLGEVDENKFEDSNFATILFVIFMFLVVILLANVLIAIVTDSYRVIQDERAAIVFWTNRLDFVAEMDAIANGPWKKRMKQAFGWDDTDVKGGTVFGKEFWKRLMDLFEDDIEDPVMSLEFWAYNFLRVVTALVLIPVWVLLGIFSAGWLWPPQLREAIFTSTVDKHSSETEKEDELRRTQVALLKKEVNELKEEMMKELKVDRTQVVQMKSTVADKRAEIANELKQIKRIMTMLFEQQSAHM
mmetsp:Transcript_32659/g.75145  ORF Transcript_32659/g.75145 Transcript_32659/m.75145 type:complete len:816 (-) Transcript_32659:1052-3499(-)